jgi:hypothetical protein
VAEEPYRLGQLDMVEDDLEDELNHPVAQALLASSNSLVEDIANRIQKARSIVANLYGSVERYGRLRRSSGIEGAAVDSTYPPEGGVELVGGLLVGIVAGYVAYTGRCSVRRMDVKVRLEIVDDEEARRRLPLKAKLLEKKLVLKLLEFIESGDLSAQAILIDGEVVPYPLLFSSKREGILGV